MRSNATRRDPDWEARPAPHQALTSPAMQAADWQEAPPPVGVQGAARSSGRAERERNDETRTRTVRSQTSDTRTHAQDNTTPRPRFATTRARDPSRGKGSRVNFSHSTFHMKFTGADTVPDMVNKGHSWIDSKLAKRFQKMSHWNIRGQTP